MGKLARPGRLMLASLFVGAAALAAWRAVSQAQASPTAPSDWRADWALSEGFALSRDTSGYQLPTALAFVPQPGAGPQDPLYFVAELGGQIKVVTNDRSVHTFAADFFERRPETELPDLDGETGLAGMCLAPAQGYVFVTYGYRDAEGLLQNGLLRFDARPNTFSLAPTDRATLNAAFAGHEAAASHQVGSCQVVDETVYVSVGDGFQSAQSQQVDSPLGKVLRMTLDGEPAPGNPYYRAGEAVTPAAYVWAYGFRNPFGLKAVGQQLFVADNGRDLDRFVEVGKGENYLWDGTDWSIGARADVVLSPDVGPAQMEYVGQATAGWPEPYAHSFYMAMSKPEVTGILRIGYRLTAAAEPGVPGYFLKYQGNNTQVVVGVAMGPDGLYFTPLFPDAGGGSAVYKVAFAPDEPHPFTMSNTTDPMSILQLKGCLGCHELYGEGGTAAPTLDPVPLAQRLAARLAAPDYLARLAEIDALSREPYLSYTAARAEVAQAEGQERLRAWMIYHIMEPKFDNPSSQMPNLGVTEAEATIITDFLLEERTPLQQVQDFILKFLPTVPRPRDIFFAFALGLMAGMLLLGGVMGSVSLLTRRGRGRGDDP